MLNRLSLSLSLVMGLVVLLVFSIGSTRVLACGWMYGGQQDIQAREDWMSQLDDTLRILNLSIPGTHETMARFGTPSYWCQSLRLGQQLRAGIRAVDLRCRHCHDRFAIHHGNKYQAAWFGEPLNIPGHWNAGDESVVNTCIQFLLDNPTETIIMRVKHDSDHDPTRAFWQTFQWYLEEDSCVIQDSVYWYKDFFWQDTTWSYQDSLPTLGDIRGKIFVLQQFDSPENKRFGPLYPGGDNGWFQTDLIAVQDVYEVLWLNSSFNWKWWHISDAINATRDSYQDQLFLNYTSGSGGVNPRDVAKGIFTPFTWFIPWLGRYSQGMNERTYRRLKSYFHSNDLGRVGIIMMDYPGAGLIDVIIAQNGLQSYCLNDPPVADAGGPYEAVEGSEIVLNASGSYDPDGSSLQYRWHLWGFGMTADSTLDTTRIWDAEDWSDTPIAHYTIYDEDTCYAVLEVREVPPGQVVVDMAGVTVTNAAPFVTIDSLISPVEGCILPWQEVHFYGSFTDPGVHDTHTAQWDFGDGTSLPDTVTEEHEIPDASGTVSHTHVYSEPGTYGVLLTVTDDDGGTGEDSLEVWVRTASEAVDFLDSLIQDLPSSAFRGQAAQRKQALSNKCQAVKHSIIAGGDLEGVINKLMNDIRSKADGSVDGKPQDDWITSEEAQEKLCLIVDELVKFLESLRGPVPTSVTEQHPPPVRKEGGSGVAKVSRKELIPPEFSLSQCYPNPFKPDTQIHYQVPKGGHVTLKIFNVMGQEIVTVVDNDLTAGSYPVTWNGRDAQGREVSAGIYFCTMEAGEFCQTIKMVLLR
jgi:1-phosphatidylinositol phosphodiesterase